MIRVNYEATSRLSEYLKSCDLKSSSFNFYSHYNGHEIIIDKEAFPSIGDAGVINFFFAVTAQNYGFWDYNSRGYSGPITGSLNGRYYMGSDFLSALSMNVYNSLGPCFFEPKNLANLSYGDFLKWFPLSSGFKDLPLRYKITTDYGQAVLRRRCSSPEEIVDCRPSLKKFLKYTSEIPGYDRDPLMKKNLLLAMIMKNRPENFLKIEGDKDWPPIVDYHLMRVALRLGLVEFTDEENYRGYWLNVSKFWVSEEMGEKIRIEVYDAWKEVIRRSGFNMSEIDFFVWSLARKFCFQMENPKCSLCRLGGVCCRRIGLFQPIYLTTNF